MAQNSERASYFPAIEQRYGEPISYWFEVMADIADRKYPEQMAYLQENYGLSRAHANALIMHSRGSTSSRRFRTFAEYLKGKDRAGAQKAREIFKVVTDKYPEMKLVIAWNSPILKLGDDYIFGVHVSGRYLLIAPYGGVGLDQLADKLEGYQVLKKTVRVPFDWEVDRQLVLAMVKARLAQLK